MRENKSLIKKKNFFLLYSFFLEFLSMKWMGLTVANNGHRKRCKLKRRTILFMIRKNIKAVFRMMRLVGKTSWLSVHMKRDPFAFVGRFGLVCFDLNSFVNKWSLFAKPNYIRQRRSGPLHVHVILMVSYHHFITRK